MDSSSINALISRKQLLKGDGNQSDDVATEIADITAALELAVVVMQDLGVSSLDAALHSCEFSLIAKSDEIGFPHDIVQDTVRQLRKARAIMAPAH